VSSSCQFIASSDVRYLLYVTLSTFPHVTSGRLRRRLPSGDQVIVRLGHLLSNKGTTFPDYFNTFFSLSL